MGDNSHLILSAIDRLENKADKMQQDIADIKSTMEVHAHHLGDYNDSLKEHMRRTQLLEGRVDKLEDESHVKKIQQSFLRRRWKTLATIGAVISAFASAAWSIFQILGK